MLKASCVEVNGLKVKGIYILSTDHEIRQGSHDCQDVQLRVTTVHIVRIPYLSLSQNSGVLRF